MTTSGEMRLSCIARADQSAPIRHAVAAFLRALHIDPDTSDDILTAVGEALANAVEHAYPDDIDGIVALTLQTLDEENLLVSVSDFGTYRQRDRTLDRGFGLQIIRTIAREVAIDTSDGTTIRMTLNAKRGGAIAC